MTSTSAAEAAGRHATRGVARTVLVVAFWLAVWQGAAVAAGSDLLLAGPVDVLVRLVELAGTGDFWATVGRTAGRIATGFAAAAVLGVLAAAVAAGSRVVDALLGPFMTAVRAAPVVSFIILVLLWVDSGRLATVVSLLMVLPIVYANVREGIRNRDPALLEAAAVFDVPWLRRVPAVDVPAVLPYLLAACRVGVGLAWKAGVAAEVIGLPDGTVGERMYQAKVLLSSADVLAWTVVVVLASVATERLVRLGLDRAAARTARPVRVAGGVS